MVGIDVHNYTCDITVGTCQSVLAHFAGGLEELPSIFRTVRGQSVRAFQLKPGATGELLKTYIL